jgi:hypothetical protein
MRRVPRGMELAPECLAAVDRMARVLADCGHTIEESYPEALDEHDAVQHYVTVVSTNVAHGLEAWGAKVGKPVGEGDVEPLTWLLAERGRGTSAPELLATLEYVHAFGRRLAAWWGGGFDLLLTPTTGASAPEIGYLTSTADEPLRAFVRAAPYGAFTFPFNMSGQPAITLPTHWTAADVPLGTQLVVHSEGACCCAPQPGEKNELWAVGDRACTPEPGPDADRSRSSRARSPSRHVALGAPVCTITGSAGDRVSGGGRCSPAQSDHRAHRLLARSSGAARSSPRRTACVPHGADCQGGGAPSTGRVVYFAHAGFVPIESIAIHPDFDFCRRRRDRPAAEVVTPDRASARERR